MPLWCLLGQPRSLGQRMSAIGLRLRVGRRHREPTDEELRRALGDVVDALGLDPFGAATVQPVPIRVKGARVQYVVTGLLTTEPDAARAKVVDALRARHFHLRRRGPVAEFLGWQATAVRGRITLTAAVGDTADEDDTPFRHLNGASYVQLTVV